MALSNRLPSRLHHTAYVTRDQEATRKFYEEFIGLPLVASWSEADILFGAERVYCHSFFGLGDGSALAFFQFAKKEDEDLFGPKMPRTPFHHVALKADRETQDSIHRRLLSAGYKEPEMYILEHGYCRSLYVEDPNGLLLEFTVDHPDAERINRERRADAHAVLKRWLAGDHTSNNPYR